MIEQASGQDKALAGVSGRITDRTGAAISGASVSLRDAVGKTRQTTTSADGSFHLAGTAGWTVRVNSDSKRLQDNRAIDRVESEPACA